MKRAIALLLIGVAALAAGCMLDPGGGGKKVSVSDPLKPVECPQGFQWDETTKECRKSPSQ